MRKVLLVCENLSGRGGMETVFKKIIPLLQEQYGVETSAFFYGKQQECLDWISDFFSYRVYYDNFRNRKIQRFVSAYQLAKYLKALSPDCIIACSAISVYVAYWAKKLARSKVRILSWSHASLGYKKDYFRYAQAHLAISTGIKDGLLSLGIPSGSIKLVLNPVTYSDVIVPRPCDITRFLYVGRVMFEGEKCLKDLFDACAQLKGKWVLDIVGDGDDVSMCKNYLAQLGVSEHVIWHGWKSNPWDYVSNHIKETTCLVLSSDSEGLPMVLIEALMHGVYCIASDCETGPADIIQHGINGFLYEPHNINALFSMMQSVVDGAKLPESSILKESVKQFEDQQYIQGFYKALKRLNDKQVAF